MAYFAPHSQRELGSQALGLQAWHPGQASGNGTVFGRLHRSWKASLLKLFGEAIEVAWMFFFFFFYFSVSSSKSHQLCPFWWWKTVILMFFFVLFGHRRPRGSAFGGLWQWRRAHRGQGGPEGDEGHRLRAEPVPLWERLRHLQIRFCWESFGLWSESIPRVYWI